MQQPKDEFQSKVEAMLNTRETLLTKGDIISFLDEKVTLFMQVSSLQANLGSPYVAQLYLIVLALQQQQFDCITAFNLVELQRILSRSLAHQSVILLNSKKQPTETDSAFLHFHIYNSIELKKYIDSMEPMEEPPKYDKVQVETQAVKMMQQIENNKKQVKDLLLLAQNTKTQLTVKYLQELKTKVPKAKTQNIEQQASNNETIKAKHSPVMAFQKYLKQREQPKVTPSKLNQIKISPEKQKEMMQKNADRIKALQNKKMNERLAALPRSDPKNEKQRQAKAFAHLYGQLLEKNAEVKNSKQSNSPFKDEPQHQGMSNYVAITNNDNQTLTDE